MIGGKDWLDLIVVSASLLGLVTLMLVISASSRGRNRGEIVRTAALIWASVAVTLTVAWLLEARTGGAVFDVQITPRPRVISRSLTPGQIAALVVVLVVLIALYVTAILAVRRLLESRDEANVRPTIPPPPNGEADRG